MKRTPRDPSALDISAALRGWNYDSSRVNVRLIRGRDGKPKLQLRLDLGLLQMELNGRPDGKRPHRAASELDYLKRKLSLHEQRHGRATGFVLTSRECAALREESAMYYHRYLGLFVLEQFEAVVRDTQHNLDVLDLCAQYGRHEFDRLCLEQYRPYILMMHTRARASEALRQGYARTALAFLRGGIKQILRLVPREHRKEAVRESSEIRILADMLQQIRHQLPADPRLALQRKLSEAIARERYEEAAALRDQIMALQATPGQGGLMPHAAAPGQALPHAEAPGPRPKRSKSRPPRNPEQDV